MAIEKEMLEILCRILSFVVEKFRKPKKPKGAILILEPPIQKPRCFLNDLGCKEKHGVIWNLFAPNKEWFWKEGIVSSEDNFDISNLWIEGPFCPECYPKCKRILYRDDEKNIWYCIDHSYWFLKKIKTKKIKIPKDLRENTRDKVIESFRANFEKQQNEK